MGFHYVPMFDMRSGSSKKKNALRHVCKSLRGTLNSFENLRKVTGPFYRKMLLHKISGSP